MPVELLWAISIMRAAFPWPCLRRRTIRSENVPTFRLEPGMSGPWQKPAPPKSGGRRSSGHGTRCSRSAPRTLCLCLDLRQKPSGVQSFHRNLSPQSSALRFCQGSPGSTAATPSRPIHGPAQQAVWRRGEMPSPHAGQQCFSCGIFLLDLFKAAMQGISTW